MSESENVMRFPSPHRFPKASYTLTVTLPNGRQISSSVVIDPADGVEDSEVLSHICRNLDRVRAEYEIGVVFGEEDTLDGEIHAHEEAIRKAEDEIARLDADTDAKIEDLRKRANQHLADYEAAYSAEQAAAEERGRVFDPEKGGIKSKLQKHIAEAEKCKAEAKRLEEERAKAHEAHAANMARFQQEIEQRKVKRAARLKLLGK